MKKQNPFQFGDKVIVPGMTAVQTVNETIGADKIRVIDFEITERQRSDWQRTLIEGEFKFIPGRVVSIEGVQSTGQTV